MKLSELLSQVRVLEPAQGDPEIFGISYDSRKVNPGDCFVAVKGFRRDGIQFLDNAIQRGAVAVITESPPPEGPPPVAWVQVVDDRAALSRVAANLLGNEAGGVRIIGVTGTNGKTTVASLTAAIFARSAPVGLSGTLGMQFLGIGDGVTEHPSRLTTPESVDLFTFASHLSRLGGKYLVMEASSAAITLKRVADIPFSMGIFTTFSGDHLDFHQDMESYFRTKLSLFQNLGQHEWAVINVDDPMSERIIPELECRYITYGFHPNADVKPLDYSFSLERINARLKTPVGELAVHASLVGRVNLLNIMASVAAAVVFHVPLEVISAAVKEMSAVSGRLEVVHRGRFAVLVDYAHTDNALLSLLQSVKELVTGKVILVFGAGGDRDTTKRPRMGRVAAENADLLFVTSDNPRSEDPHRIISEITAGFPMGFTGFQVEVDRLRAIHAALEAAAPGDVVVLAGKGHEDYQEINGRITDFSDAAVVGEWLASRNPEAGRDG